MNEQTNPAADRRRYYRVDDRVALRWREVDEATLESALQRMHIGYPDKLSLASAFAATSANMRRSVEKVRRELPEVAAYLEGVNEKMDLLVQLLAAEENEFGERPTHRVSLSGSGLSFTSSQPLPLGTLLEIKLLMFPGYTCILAFGTVVNCVTGDAEEGGGHRIGVDFTHIREADRELVLRHVTQRQSSMLREARLSMDDAMDDVAAG